MAISDGIVLRAASTAYDSASNAKPGEGFTKLEELTGTDDPTSFEYVGYRSANGEYLIAFAGTGGLQDGYQNTKLGWEQWRRNRDAIIEDLRTVLDNDPSAQIQFTGHSLGGMLAQYAAYDLLALARVDADLPAPDQLAEQLEVTTFNAPGGIDGLEAYYAELGQGPFDPTLASGLDATHYTVEGDLVSRLGGRHLGGATRRLSAYEVATFGALGDRVERARPCGFAATPTIASHSSQLKSSVGH